MPYRNERTENPCRANARSRPQTIALIWLCVFGLGVAGPVRADDTAAQASTLHIEYDALLKKYVRELRLDYAGWVANDKDAGALEQYVLALTELDPASWSPDEQLSYWLNLYNAATLRLVLDNYPMDSIKDLGGFMKKSPWNRKLVTVAGRDLTLNEIENDIIRPEFQDPRIHFALNCAAIGCPPLNAGAFFAGTLSEQLDTACRRALNLDPWVRVEESRVYVTKIFKWYGDDFTQDGGSILEFISRYRDTPIAGHPDIKILDYDWSLNDAPRAEQ